jgi:myo-inositol 2-dehydrogenase/D-chiro-inositol 1-dehydrogenase/scyllo-inositol 2-dehydrogenase (NAD+)
MIHARNFRNKVAGARMEAVADAAGDAAAAGARELGISRYVTDYKDILDDGAVDAVVIVSPTNLHRRIAIDCARAGKHIFCEKPMAMNAAECEEMIAACEDAGVKLQIGFMRRHDASFREAKAQIDAGVIGDIVLVRSCTRGPSRPREWMYDIKKSNGILAELNSHDIDTVRWIANSDIDTYHVVAGNYRSPEVAARYPYYYDNVVMTGTFGSGAQYLIDGAAYVQYGYDAQLEVVGTKGVIRVSRRLGNGVETVTPDGNIRRPFIKSWMNLFEDAYLEEDNHFADCIRNDKTPAVTGVDGLMAVRAVERGNELIVKMIDEKGRA